MQPKKSFSILFLLLFFSIQAQTHFPGGVSGAEAWYIVDFQNLGQNEFPNHSMEHIKIKACNNPGSEIMFNFNPAINTQGLCLTYNAHLENNTSRNVFFVGELLENPNQNYSHVTTGWNPLLSNLPQLDSIIRNRFDLATQMAYVNTKEVTFQGVEVANVNFYHWNIYQTDKKFKSYGWEGETAFYIGREFSNSIIEKHGEYFKGKFPEFISYPYELNANERNRVESYLALKYGITLNRKHSYKNSKNTVFWNTINNAAFMYRTFGIGRDDISGLNQLISESVHKKKYLIASVGEYADSNAIKQEQVSIEDNNFIVFGDNTENENLGAGNAFHVEPLKRIWLSQNTGTKSPDIPMYFKLHLVGVLQARLMEDPSLKVWMLHDKYVTNLDLSDFNSHYVDYYEGVINGGDYADFGKIYFDTDRAIYDQFTFGVGPKMIVQARFKTANCDAEAIITDVVITGGSAPYYVTITGGPQGQQNFSTYSNIVTFDAYSGSTYHITVQDNNGYTVQTSIDAFPPSQLLVDFGPDLTLSVNMQQVTLDAGINVNDPEATYKWYKNGVLIEHYEATLVVTEPGEYSVIIMSGNHICEVSDTILISYNFTGTVAPLIECDSETATAHIQLNGGVPPFTTIFSGSSLTVSQVHNTEEYFFTDLEFDNYTVTITDSNGEVYQQNISLSNPVSGIDIDLVSQIEPYCEPQYIDSETPMFWCGLDMQIDASALVTNPNVTYAWYYNGEPTGITSPNVTLDQDCGKPEYLENSPIGMNEITVVITDNIEGCTITETIAVIRCYGIVAGTPAPAPFQGSPEGDEQQNTEENNPPSDSISAKVYPNPSEPGVDFNYEVISSEVFEGTIEIFTETGALLKQVAVSGQASYNLSFSLISSGTYFICTRTGETLLTNKVIIK